MTSQAKDSFYYEGERYSLFDVSDNKVLTCKKCAGDLFGGGYSTGCYRGTIASYEVKDGFLVLREAADLSGFNDVPAFSVFRSEDDEPPMEPRCLPGTIIPFTGRLIITQGGWFMDFFSRIFGAEKAFELAFDKGLFLGATDLSSFIKAGNEHEEQMPKGEDGCYEDLDFFHDTNYMMGIMKEISPIRPMGNYSDDTYVWRADCSECVLCGSSNTPENK